ncbi:MAG: transglutaminase-like domain-containing protein [Nanoarchaeota archaeon]
MGLLEDLIDRLRKKQEKPIKERIVEKIITKPVDVSHVTLEKILESENSLIAIPITNFYGTDLNFFVNTNEYFKFKVQKHRNIPIKDFVNFVTYSHPKIKEIAQFVVESTKTKNPAQTLLDFTHRFIYNNKIEQISDYVRYPIETLVERNGDCEDLCILAAALMKSIAIDVALIHLPNPYKQKPGHIALGVCGNFEGVYCLYKGKKYFYAESTGTDWLSKPADWKIGQVPEEYKNSKVRVYVVP